MYEGMGYNAHHPHQMYQMPVIPLNPTETPSSSIQAPWGLIQNLPLISTSSLPYPQQLPTPSTLYTHDAPPTNPTSKYLNNNSYIIYIYIYIAGAHLLITDLLKGQQYIEDHQANTIHMQIAPDPIPSIISQDRVSNISITHLEPPQQLGRSRREGESIPVILYIYIYILV